MASNAVFYTESEAVITRKIEALTLETEEDKIENVYEIQKCISWINQHKYKQVALQFPDELMTDAVTVFWMIQQHAHAECRVFILGDTSYGSCCVDEVAAQHYCTDALIHFGHSCHSAPSQLPVLFVFGRMPLDVIDCVNQIRVLFPDTSSNVILWFDSVYMYACSDILRLLQGYKNLITSNFQDSVDDLDCVSEYTQITKCGRHMFIPKDRTLLDYSIVYIGIENATLTNLLYNFKSSQFYSYNPVSKDIRKEGLNVNKLLRKRYFYIEKVKDAKIIGILLGTLGVKNFVEILNRVKSIIKKAGKKSYTFIVGKINVAKLANFMEINIFVQIACPENSLLDSSEFYKPVVTPYELELALLPDREWTGEYHTDFSELLEGGCHYLPVPENFNQTEPDISLVTGKIRVSTQNNDVHTADTQVVLQSDSGTVATVADSAGEFLGLRSWKGLEKNLGETCVTKFVEGQRGLAAGYANEPN